MKKGFLSVYEKGFPFSALFMYEKKRRKRKTILAHMRWRTGLTFLFFCPFLGLYALAHCTDCAGGGGGSHFY